MKFKSYIRLDIGKVANSIMVLRHPVKMKDVCSNQTLPAIFIMKYILFFLLSFNCYASKQKEAINLASKAAYKQTELDKLANGSVKYLKENYIPPSLFFTATAVYQIGYKKEIRFKRDNKSFVLTNKFIGVTIPFN